VTRGRGVDGRTWCVAACMAQARQPVFLGAAQRPTTFGVPTVRAVHHGAVVESVRRSTARSTCGAQDACTRHGRGDVGTRRQVSPCSFGLLTTSQQYFSLRTNQPHATSQQYFSLTTNQHQPSATTQKNRMFIRFVPLQN
jgi:hypothetical protein